MFCLLDNMHFHKSFVRGQYLCFFFSSFGTFAEKFLILLILLFVFSCSLSNDRPCERCNDAWYHAIQLVVWFCNDVFKLIYLFLIIGYSQVNSHHYVDN